MRLLLVEDDFFLGQALSHILRAESHLVDWCTTLSQAKGLVNEPYDALLLDWNLPDGSGVEWLASLRARRLRVPALILTAHDRLADRVHGLDCGADDFMVKPFAPEELCARLRAVVRRASGNLDRKQYGPVEIDVTAKAVWLNGVAVVLTSREWAILECLVLRQGRIVSKQEIESLVLGLDGELASNSVEVYIFKLRHKLGKALIETVRGLGYRISEA